ncbi:MAG: hypothetical protein WC637_16840 [Victivallales bacterium]|jgi:hypothetical protein
MSERKGKSNLPDTGADHSARPVWISKALFEAIHRIKEEKGVNLSSVVEELIESGIKCHNMKEPYDIIAGHAYLPIRAEYLTTDFEI